MDALIDCGATSLFISKRLVHSLGFQNQTCPAYTTTRGLDGTILAHAKDSRKLSLKLQYLPHLAPIEEPDLLVVGMKPYDLVLGLPWFRKYNPDIDWVKKCLISLRNSKVPISFRIESEGATPADDLEPVGKLLVDTCLLVSR